MTVVCEASSHELRDHNTSGTLGSDRRGECEATQLPDDAKALVLNVTALGATDLSFLTFWPDGTQPIAASLNPAPGQPPVPNAVTTNLSAANTFNVFNNRGNVHT